MITSESAVFGAQFKSFFILGKSYASFFRYSIFYILKNSVNFESLDIIISVWAPGGIHL